MCLRLLGFIPRRELMITSRICRVLKNGARELREQLRATVLDLEQSGLQRQWDVSADPFDLACKLVNVHQVRLTSCGTPGGLPEFTCRCKVDVWWGVKSRKQGRRHMGVWLPGIPVCREMRPHVSPNLLGPTAQLSHSFGHGLCLNLE